MDGHMESDGIKSKHDAPDEPLVLTILGCGMSFSLQDSNNNM